MSEQTMRFGIWAAVHGNRGALQDPEEPCDASWERNRALVLEAEALGFDATLIAQHTMNPYDNRLDQLEAWTAAAALAALTSRIEIIAAIKPALYHPVVLAKMALGIEVVACGRFAINVVNAWNKAEFERAGIPFGQHDDRYGYGREWLAAVAALMAGERVTVQGEHFRLDDYVLRPADPYRARPRIYIGGESEPARALVADHGDVWFFNGQPIDDVRTLMRDVAGRPRQGTPVRFGLSAFVIARETEAEAQQAHERLLALSAKDGADARGQPRQHRSPPSSCTRPWRSRRGWAATAAPRPGSSAATTRWRSASPLSIVPASSSSCCSSSPSRPEMRRFAHEVMPRARAQSVSRAA